MKKVVLSILTAATLLMMSACSSMSTTGKGALIGTGGGAALGAALGALIGHNGKGAAIGAAIGTAVGAGTGAAIGKAMQNKQEKLSQELANQAQVETITDANGLTAIKVTFDADMTFPKNGYTLKSAAQSAVKKFATNINTADLINTEIQIKGHTDSSGGDRINQPLSEKRAKAVGDILRANGVSNTRIVEMGLASSEPITGNAADAANRRVEVYVLATEAMVQQYANAQ